MGSPAKTLDEWLQQTHWMQLLPTNARGRVLADAQEHLFRAGDLVARKGEPAAHWFGVMEGLLKVSAVYRSGKVVMFAGLPEGSWVGEGSVIKRELRRYDVVAMRPSRVVQIPHATFRWLLDSSIEFNHVVIARLNERLGQFIAMMEIDRLSDPVARVARAIGTLYNPVLYPNMSPLLSLSQTELGELIGLSRQSIGAALKQLQGEGLLSMGYGGIVIRDLHALAAYEERELARGGEGACVRALPPPAGLSPASRS